jgi:protein gp37
MTNPIGWCTRTWNPITGCSKASAGCEHCYAERMSRRLAGRYGYPADDPFRVTFHPERLDEPLRWRTPQRVFVGSMGDLFHEEVERDWLAQIWEIMAAASWHTFLIPTKRPERARGMFTALPNVWLGVTVENQENAYRRIPILLRTPATHRFVSCEPLLGPVELSGAFYDYLRGWHTEDGHAYDCDGSCRSCPVPVQVRTEHIEWVIVGGESGPGARPMHPDWARGLRDECLAAGVPLFFKQWGEWAPLETADGLYSGCRTWTFREPRLSVVARVGKKAAGHLLDGKEYRESPQGWPR